jgi:hypothetical protein
MSLNSWSVFASVTRDACFDVVPRQAGVVSNQEYFMDLSGIPSTLLLYQQGLHSGTRMEAIRPLICCGRSFVHFPLVDWGPSGYGVSGMEHQLAAL